MKSKATKLNERKKKNMKVVPVGKKERKSTCKKQTIDKRVSVPC